LSFAPLSTQLTDCDVAGAVGMALQPPSQPAEACPPCPQRTSLPSPASYFTFQPPPSTLHQNPPPAPSPPSVIQPPAKRIRVQRCDEEVMRDSEAVSDLLLSPLPRNPPGTLSVSAFTNCYPVKITINATIAEATNTFDPVSTDTTAPVDPTTAPSTPSISAIANTYHWSAGSCSND
jgi:hypothetical protein